MARVARRIEGAPRVTALVCLVIAVGLLSAVVADRARPWLRDRALSAINAELPGTLVIEHLDGVSLLGLDARGVSLRDEQGTVVAAAERAHVELRPWALLGGVIGVSEVVLDDAYVDLGDPSTQRGGLLGLFASQPGADEAPEDEGDEGLELQLDRITLRRAHVRAELEGADWRAQGLEAVAWARIGPELRVGVRRLDARLERMGRPLARLGPTKLRYDPRGQSYAELALGAQAARVSAKLRLGPERGEAPRQLRGWLDARRLDAAALAGAGVDVSGLEGSFDLQLKAEGTTARARARLALATEGARVEADAWAGTDGAFEGYARARAAELSRAPVAQGFAPGARGAFELAVHAARDAVGAYHGEGWLGLARAGYGSSELRRLSVDARAHGHGLAPPAIELDLGASGLAAGRARLRAARVHVRGGREGYVANGTLDTGRVSARMRPERDGWLASGALTLPLDGDVLSARLGSLHVNEQRVALQALTLAYRDARARFDGSLQGDERLQLRARVRVPELAQVTSPFVARPVEGSADLALDASGPLPAPRVKLAAGYRADALAGVRQPVLRLDLDADLPARRLVASTRLRARGIAAELDASARLPRGALSAASLRRAKGRVELRVAHLALHELQPWPELRLAPSQAVLAGSVHAEGTLAAFQLGTDVRARARFARAEAPLTATLHGELGPEGVSLRLRAADEAGPLLRSDVSLDVGSKRPTLELAHVQRLLLERSWEVALWLGARRIDELPLTRALAIPEGLWPARVSADLTLAHRPGQEPRGTADLRAVWDPPAQGSLSPRCGAVQRPKIALAAKMQDGRLHTDLRAGSGERTTLVASSASHAPIDEWLRVKPLQVRPVQIHAELDDLRLAQIPVVCEQATGTLDGQAKLERGLTQAVTVELEVEGHALRFADSPPVQARLAARAEQAQLIGSATLRTSGGAADLAAELPLDRGGFVPSLAWSAPATASMRLWKLPLSALIGPVPGLRSSGGTLAGEVAMKGSLAKPAIDGRLSIYDVTLTLGELGQRFERLNGEIELHGRALALRDISFRDLDGRATAHGRMHWRSFDPISFQGDFELRASRLPIRRSGVLAARLDGLVGVKVDAAPERIEVDGRLRKGRIELTTADLSAVQSLDPNPDISFTDDPPELLDEHEDETEVRIRIDASEPFWVRREDFSALVTARLRISAQPDPPAITGTVDVRRGVVELLGQMFDIERGRIRFTGGSEVDPQLDLVASRTAPGAGERVTITAKGSVREPELRFAIDGAPVTAGEALAAALGTRPASAGDQRVQDQLGSIATGIAGSVLTVGARRELGEWVPVLGFEQGGGETRVRAGVEADRLIPRFLRGVVVDAYVEGIVSSREQTDDGQVTAESSTGAAVLLELRFPHSLSSEAQYGPGPRWSLDLNWEP